jgi:uncharacterized protein DUF6940
MTVGFRTRSEKIGAHAIRTAVDWNGAPVSVRDAMSLLEQDVSFRSGLIAALRSSPFTGYFWETPSVTTATSNLPFEFVLIDAPSFQRVAPERSAFEEHFAGDSDRDGIVTFENLGRDATLIVPCPVDDESKYSHLAAFARNGPTAQVDALFEAVGRATRRRISDRPLWLSTAGMGVYWLHVRLDSRPKYYRHDPYKRPRQPA